MANTESESAFFRASTEIVIRFRWFFLALTALATAGALYLIVTDLKVDNSTEYFASGNEEVSEQLELFRDDFGRDDLFFLLVEGDVFSMDFLDRLRELHTNLEATDLPLTSLGQRKSDRDNLRVGKEIEAAPAPQPAGFEDDFGDFGDDEGWGDEAGGSVVEEVISLINFRQTIGTDGGIRVRGLLDDRPAESDLVALKAEVLANPSMVGNVIGPDATHTVLAIRTQFMDEEDTGKVNDHLFELANQFDAPGFEVSLTGGPALNHSLNQTVLEDTSRLMVLSTIVMGFVLLYLFRRFMPVFAPLVVVIVSACWTLAAMTIFGAPMTILTSIIPAFLICVGLADSIHIQSVWRDEIAEGVGLSDALVRAVAMTGVPIVFTTMTTMAGLLSFRFASATAIQEMGMAGAFGVAMALLNSVVFLPAALSFSSGPATVATDVERAPDLVDSFLDRCTSFSVGNGRWWTIGVGAVFAVIAFVGISNLDVYHNPLVWLGEQHPITVSTLEMDAKVGGVSGVHVVFESDSEFGVKDRELLMAIDELADSLEGFEHPRTGEHIVTSTMSLADVVRETNRALHDGDQGFYSMPDTQRGVSDALLLFENAGPDELNRLVTGDLKRSHLMIRVKWMDATSYRPFEEFIEREIDRIIGDKAEVIATGTIYTILAVVETLISDLLRSFGVALIAVTLMMIWLLRDLKLGLVSMVPNLLPIALVMGFMGYVGIDIDLSNLLIASIIIGIAVDDTVHYLHQYKVGYKIEANVETAIQHALHHAGRAIVSTSVVLTLGFGVFLASRLISIQRFGLLIGFACMLAVVVDLILTPALLRVLYAKKAPATNPGVGHVTPQPDR